MQFFECEGGCGRLLNDQNALSRRTRLCKTCRYKSKVRNTGFSGKKAMMSIRAHAKKGD